MSTPRQPRKKRRIDTVEEKDSNIPPEVLPLVHPTEVVKSSKDPNRGMYPKKTPSKKRPRLSCPSFSNASKLLRGASTSKDTDISLAEISIQETPITSKSKNSSLKTSSEKTKAHSSNSTSDIRPRKKTAKSKFPGGNLMNKIFNYFRPIPVKKTKEEAYSSSDDFQEPSTSKLQENPKPESSKSLQVADIPKKDSSNSSSDEKVEAFFKALPNCYGLVGEFEDVDDRPNYFERLPCHVLETILCQIPFVDLMKYKLVCSAWNDVINEEAFMPFKKIYYALKAGEDSAAARMSQICKSYEMSSVENCFAVIIKYMSEEFCRRTSHNLFNLLSQNQKAIEAEVVLAERFPEVLTKDSKAWSIFATAMLLSETVNDVYSLYQSVNKWNSLTPMHDITNAMYAIAAFFLYFRNKYGINHGLHYRVYNALYWIENNLPPAAMGGSKNLKVPKGLPGQQSIHSYGDSSKSDLTYEQLRILNHCFQPDQIIKIVALAGTGKTTTLIHLAKLHPRINFLNVMFNKAVCDEAKKRFPTNVTCRTAHSLAYAVYGNRLRFKLSTKIRPHDIVQHLKYNVGSRIQTFPYAKLVLATIEKYVGSADREMKFVHTPACLNENPPRIIEAEDRSKTLKDAIQIWEKMIDQNNKNIRITHDTYLKLFQLSQPKFTEYNCIMVDEAQDCNPAMLDIVMSQKVPVIVVGDPNQQIYGFRGAKNAIQSLTATHTYHLTKSFRFGPEIAYIASCCLEVLNDNTRQTIVGTNKSSSVDGSAVGQYAILARGNVNLFNEAIRLCCLKRYKNNEPTNIQGAFAGGLKGYGFDQMMDIYRLSTKTNGSDTEVSDKFISRFRSYRDLVNYAKSVEDSELLTKIEVVNQHSTQLPDYIKMIKEKCSHPIELANVVFSTVHKSKGLEFDTVSLTDDFIIPESQIGAYGRSINSEENNILYVAVTRAKKSLVMPDKLMRVLLLAQEKFEHPMLSSKVLGTQTEVECAHCSEVFTPHTKFLLVRRKMVQASGHVTKGGPLCVKCATEPKFRPRINYEPAVVYLDPMDDMAHRSMSALVGPLPNDPPIVRENIEIFNEMDFVYIINVRM